MERRRGRRRKERVLGKKGDEGRRGGRGVEDEWREEGMERVISE